LINPEHLNWLLDLLGDKPYPFETLIVDESSMFKDVSTKRFARLRWKVKNFSRRYIMTGTPTPNRLLELWPQIFLLDLGQRLGSSYGKFKERFFDQDYTGYKWEPKPGAEKKIYSLIADITLRMDNKDYLSLPKVTFNHVKVSLPEAVRKLYRSVEKDAMAQISQFSRITAVNAPAELIKCRQIANGVVYATKPDGTKTTEVLHSEKLRATREIVEETGSPVIVVYNFKHELALLQEELKDFSPVVLTESKNAERTIDDWNSGKIQVLLLHPASGGHGLNLQEGGHTLIWYALNFSYEQYLQVNARINRQGQKFPVMIHILVAEDTVDELLVDLMASKAAGQDRLFDYLKAYGAKHH
jgi:SNF2 family DNA or RNA helicase